jgi:hypothetical protein
MDRKIFDSLLEAKVLIEGWRVEYNTRRPHSSLGYRPPAPETVLVDPSAFAPAVGNSNFSKPDGSNISTGVIRGGRSFRRFGPLGGRKVPSPGRASWSADP